MKIGIAIQGCTTEKLHEALSKSSGPVHATHEFHDYIWPAVVFEAEDLGDGHGYYATEQEFLIYAFEWALRWRLGVPVEAQCITADGYRYDDSWRKEMEAKTAKLIAEQSDTVTIPRKRAMELEERDQWLTCLENAGVDNWDGIDEARNLKAEYEGE